MVTSNRYPSSTSLLGKNIVPFCWVGLIIHHVQVTNVVLCLQKFLRWYIYPEYYDFRLNATSTKHAGKHPPYLSHDSIRLLIIVCWKDHCIENLRRNIMCLPSLEIMTFDWVPNS